MRNSFKIIKVCSKNLWTDDRKRLTFLEVNTKQAPALWAKVRKIFVRAEKAQKALRRKAIERVEQIGELRKVRSTEVFSMKFVFVS